MDRSVLEKAGKLFRQTEKPPKSVVQAVIRDYQEHKEAVEATAERLSKAREYVLRRQKVASKAEQLRQKKESLDALYALER